jgi:hypothetical protein
MHLAGCPQTGHDGSEHFEMTIALAWVRTVGKCEELVFASDSRLCGDGRIIDVCQKAMTLPRSDCAVVFAGDTEDAYPLLQLMSSAIAAHAPLHRRSMDIRPLLAHTLKIFDGLANAIAESIPETEIPKATFIFGGYSWVQKNFCLWRIQYSITKRAFIAVEAKHFATHRNARKIFTASRAWARDTGCLYLGQFIAAGDQGEEATHRLNRLIADRMAAREDCRRMRGFDMEPFEVVCAMLRDPSKARSIGGAPQLVKVYQYLESAPLAVYWPHRASGSICLSGRPILGYERIDRWILDPDSLRSEHMSHSPRHTLDDVLSTPEPRETDDA